MLGLLVWFNFRFSLSRGANAYSGLTNASICSAIRLYVRNSLGESFGRGSSVPDEFTAVLFFVPMLMNWVANEGGDDVEYRRLIDVAVARNIGGGTNPRKPRMERQLGGYYCRVRPLIRGGYSGDFIEILGWNWRISGDEKADFSDSAGVSGPIHDVELWRWH